jgi:hypothetical protein
MSPLGAGGGGPDQDLPPPSHAAAAGLPPPSSASPSSSFRTGNKALRAPSSATTANFGSSYSTKKRLPPPTIKNAERIGPLIIKPDPHDILFGRGGGTNVHIGNKIFRDLINARRREYLKAKKNDKPAISRRIVHEIHTRYGGRFLKKADDDDGGATAQEGWYEVDDRSSREKVSQALRQRAPELKK